MDSCDGPLSRRQFLRKRCDGSNDLSDWSLLPTRISRAASMLLLRRSGSLCVRIVFAFCYSDILDYVWRLGVGHADNFSYRDILTVTNSDSVGDCIEFADSVSYCIEFADPDHDSIEYTFNITDLVNHAFYFSVAVNHPRACHADVFVRVYYFVDLGHVRHSFVMVDSAVGAIRIEPCGQLFGQHKLLPSGGAAAWVSAPRCFYSLRDRGEL
jgi:hypothetical protein